MVIVDPRGKEAELSYQLKARYEDYSLVHITLKTGRSHQIRVQFSSRNYPLYGDQRYNKLIEYHGQCLKKIVKIIILSRKHMID